MFTLALSEPEFELSRPRADSIAGLAATLAAYSIGAGASRGLSEEVAGGEQVLRYVREMEKTFLRNGAEAVTGPVDLDGLVAQEQAVVALNTSVQGGLAASESPFVAIYPREGTFWADHPMALLNLDGDGPALTRNQGRTYHAFAQFLLTEDSQIELMRAGFRPADLTIDMNVPPSPFENSVAVDLSEPKSLLRSPSAPFMQVLLDVWRVAGPPANLVMVVDASESMEGDKLSQSKATLHELIELMQDDHDRLGVIGIGSGMTNSRRMRWLDSEGRSRFRLELETMEAGGYTGLVDAVLEAHAALQQSGDAGAVNVIVVLSDGRDNDSESKLLNLHRAMGEGSIPVLIHTIGYGGDANERLLRELARIGDGQFHRAEGVDIEGPIPPHCDPRPCRKLGGARFAAAPISHSPGNRSVRCWIASESADRRTEWLDILQWLRQAGRSGRQTFFADQWVLGELKWEGERPPTGRGPAVLACAGRRRYQVDPNRIAQVQDQHQRSLPAVHQMWNGENQEEG